MSDGIGGRVSVTLWPLHHIVTEEDANILILSARALTHHFLMAYFRIFETRLKMMAVTYRFLAHWSIGSARFALHDRHEDA
jgi:hypothetical protein